MGGMADRIGSVAPGCFSKIKEMLIPSNGFSRGNSTLGGMGINDVGKRMKLEKNLLELN